MWVSRLGFGLFPFGSALLLFALDQLLVLPLHVPVCDADPQSLEKKLGHSNICTINTAPFYKAHALEFTKVQEKTVCKALISSTT
jgi:hypothetical protein